SGEDILFGGDGDDTLTGGPGKDLFVIDYDDNGTDTITDYEIGEDEVYFVASAGEFIFSVRDNNEDNDAVVLFSNTYIVFKGIESPYNSIYVGYGSLITGTSGDDILEGDDGVVNRLIGREGNDRLEGKDYDDNLSGGPDEDILLGGEGNDTLTGEPGKDIFVIYGDDGTDTITDYEIGEDEIYFVASVEPLEYYTGNLQYGTTEDNDAIVHFLNTHIIFKGIDDYSSIIKDKILSEMQSPVPGTSLNSTTATFTWGVTWVPTNTGCVSHHIQYQGRMYMMGAGK
ncbi:MAG: hypothetical protein GY749_35420, partial [Desulfobacteraceae bacterium]|nr:hypothetical protein [Desulfobacteraceae bacterium]